MIDFKPPHGQLIAPGGFLVIKDVKSTKGYDIKSDVNWQSVLSKTSGAVRLLRPNATKSDTIDSMQYDSFLKFFDDAFPLSFIRFTQ